MADPIRPGVIKGEEKKLESVALDDYSKTTTCVQSEPKSDACRKYTEEMRSWYENKVIEMNKYGTGYQGEERVKTAIWKLEIAPECKKPEPIKKSWSDFFPWEMENREGVLQTCKYRLLNKGELPKAEDPDMELLSQLNAAPALESVPARVSPVALGNAFYKAMVKLFGKAKAGSVDLKGAHEEVVTNLKQYATDMKAQYGGFELATVDDETITVDSFTVKIGDIRDPSLFEGAAATRAETAMNMAREKAKAVILANADVVAVKTGKTRDEVIKKFIIDIGDAIVGATPSTANEIIASEVAGCKSGQDLVKLVDEMNRFMHVNFDNKKPFPETLAKQIQELPETSGDTIARAKDNLRIWQARNQNDIYDLSSQIDEVVKADGAEFQKKYAALVLAVEVKRQARANTVQNRRTDRLEEDAGLNVQPVPAYEVTKSPTDNWMAFGDWVSVQAARNKKTDEVFLKEIGIDPNKFIADGLAFAGLDDNQAKAKYEEYTAKIPAKYSQKRLSANEVQDKQLKDLNEATGVSIKDPPAWDDKITPAVNVQAFFDWLQVQAERNNKSENEVLTELGLDPNVVIAEALAMSGQGVSVDKAKESYNAITDAAISSIASRKRVSLDVAVVSRVGYAFGKEEPYDAEGVEQETPTHSGGMYWLLASDLTFNARILDGDLLNVVINASIAPTYGSVSLAPQTGSAIESSKSPSRGSEIAALNAGLTHKSDYVSLGVTAGENDPDTKLKYGTKFERASITYQPPYVGLGPFGYVNGVATAFTINPLGDGVKPLESKKTLTISGAWYYGCPGAINLDGSDFSWGKDALHFVSANVTGKPHKRLTLAGQYDGLIADDYIGDDAYNSLTLGVAWNGRDDESSKGFTTSAQYRFGWMGSAISDHMITGDLIYYLNKRVGLGVGLAYSQNAKDLTAAIPNDYSADDGYPRGAKELSLLTVRGGVTTALIPDTLFLDVALETMFPAFTGESIGGRYIVLPVAELVFKKTF